MCKYKWEQKFPTCEYRGWNWFKVGFKGEHWCFYTVYSGGLMEFENVCNAFGELCFKKGF